MFTNYLIHSPKVPVEDLREIFSAFLAMKRKLLGQFSKTGYIGKQQGTTVNVFSLPDEIYVAWNEWIQFTDPQV